MKRMKGFISLLFLFFGIRDCYGSVISKNIPGPFESHSEYSELPKGTVLGDYWDVYRISSMAHDSLQALPFNNNTVRNFDWRELALASDNFYVLNPSSEVRKNGLFQFGYFFKPTGKHYYCNEVDVLLYKKSAMSPLSKFIIRAANKKYVSLKSNGCLLADEIDSSKAEIFSLVVLRWMGSGLKSSNGKFIKADLNSNSKLLAESDYAWNWENFEISPLNNSSVSLKLFNGKYVCADFDKGDTLYANRDWVQEWESFEIIPK